MLCAVALLLTACGQQQTEGATGAPTNVPPATAVLAPAHPTPLPVTTGAWARAGSPTTTVHRFLRTRSGVLYASLSTGVYSSHDDGATWSVLGQGFPGPNVDAWSIAFVPGGATLLAAAADGYVYRLVDSVGRWRRSTAMLSPNGVYALLATPATHAVLAGSDHGIARSTDGGVTWHVVAPLPNTIVTTFARDAASNTLYAGLAGARGSIQTSKDDGRSWHTLQGVLPPSSVESILITGARIYVGVMQTSGRLPVWARGRGANGTNFGPLVAGLPSTNAHGMTLAATTAAGEAVRILIGTMGSGVYERTVGGAWTKLGPNPGDGTVTALLVLPGRHPIALAGTADGVYRTRLP